MPPTMKAAPPSQHYNVRRVMLQVELEHFDPKTGKVTGTSMSEPTVMFESEFPDGLIQYLVKKGLNPDAFKSTEPEAPVAAE